MKKNMGSSDKIIRLLLAAAMIVLVTTGVVTGLLATILIIFAGVFILTSLVSFCPLYTLIGMNTCKTEIKK